MLHRRDENLVAAPDVGIAPRPRDEVDALGGVARVDDLPGRLRIEKRADRLPRRLVGVGRPLAEQMDTAVDVRVVGLVVAAEDVDDRPRLLRRRRVVEIDERTSMNALSERRKFGADRGDVERERQC
jgi:hypothetical protein